jgi:biotin carboxylase
MATINGAIIIVGHAADWQRWMERLVPGEPVVFIDEPDVIRKRGIAEVLASAPGMTLIGCEYQADEAAARFAASRPDERPAAVVPGMEYAVPFVAELAEHYGLPGSGAAAAILRDKALLRSVTGAAGIANPVSREVTGAADVLDFITEHGLPAVLKPANRQGSVGTRILTAADQVASAWVECMDQGEGTRTPDRVVFPLRMLVESFVTGPEFSVELLVTNGRRRFANVTGKHLFTGARPVEQGHTIPADISDHLTRTLIAATDDVIAAVGFDSGIVHCEWIVPESGVPHLVECAGRMAGDMIVPMIDYIYSIDLPGLFLDILRGIPIKPEPVRPEEHAAVRFQTARPGRVTEIAGLEDAEDHPDVLKATVTVQPGEVVQPLRSSYDRVASVIAVGPTGPEAEGAADKALSYIKVITTEAT